MQHKVMVKVAKAKQRVYEDLCDWLNTKKGDMDLYRLVMA